MALMTAMREKMHIVLWVLLAMFLLSMTIGGLVGGANIIDQLFGNIDPTTTIAQVNGEKVAPDRFNALVNQQLETMRSRNQEITDNEINRARQTAWDNLLQDILVSQEVEKLEISASNEEVLYYLENNPPPFLTQNPSFQTDGKFDSEKFKEALSNPQGDEWAPIEAFMKNTYIPNFKLQKMLDESLIVTESEMINEFIKNNINFVIDGIHLKYNTVATKDSKPAENKLLKYYEVRGNEFKHDELRNIRSVSWIKNPSKSDSMNVFEKSNQILKEAKSGSNFKNLANKYTDDPGNLNGSKGGDLGWIKKGRMDKAFEEAVFSASKNEIVGPIKSKFGYHIIFCRDIRNNKEGKKEVLTSHILLRVEISPSTLSDLKREAVLFSYDAQDNGFDETVKTYNKSIINHEKILQQDISIASLGPFRSAVRFAFENDINSVSDLLQNDEHFSVFIIDKITKPGIKPFDDVKNQIENEMKRKNEKAIVLDRINNLLIKISSSETNLKDMQQTESNIEIIESEKGTLSRGFKGLGRSNFVSGALMKSNIGDLVGPLETRSGYTILKINEIEDFDSILYKEKKETIYQTIFNQKQNQFFKSWLDELKEKSDIIDNRKFYF
jgi:peptidyl-prolyl cis-trans isomerase D